MNHLVSRSFLVALTALLASCAGTETVEPVLTKDRDTAVCEIEQTDLEIVLVNAMDRLLADWPVLDRECETFLRRIEVSSAGECLLSGEPTNAAGCDDPDYAYKVAFNPKTLEAYQIYWISK